MKICSKCKVSQPEEAFAFKNKASGVRTGVCKECHKKYTNEHYQRNKDTIIPKNRARARVAKNRTNDYTWDYLSTHPCVDCGETDIVVLDFDHRDPLLRNGGRVFSFQGCSLKKIQEEIDKCDVVCCNCHRRRTAKMFGWKRLEWERRPAG